MTENINTIKEFISSAEKSRKYPQNTANGLKAALKLFEIEMNTEEKDSLELLRKNLEQIYSNVFQKNKTKMSAGSLQAYKSRVLKLLKDYETYGKDPSKMAAWSPTIILRKPRQEKKVDIDEINPVNKAFEEKEATNTNRHELNLGNSRVATISTPFDLTVEEVKKISAYIKYLNVLAGGVE